MLMVPAAIVTGLGSMIAGMWLLFLWDWRPVLMALVLGMVGPLILGFALTPGVMFGLAVMKAIESDKRTIALIFTFLHSFYQSAILTGWCLATLIYFASFADSRLTFVLNLVLSSGVACGVLAFLASKEPENPYSGTTTAFVQLAYFISVAGLSFKILSLTEVIAVFVITVGGWTVLSANEWLKSAEHDFE
jgi:hypothetical protein